MPETETPASAMVRAHIRRAGHIGFEDFIRIALHDPQVGYYGSGVVRFGADFDTAPTISPLFGAAIAAAIMPTLTKSRGNILELGGGNGDLAKQILGALQTTTPDLYHRTQYTLLETSPALRACQQQKLCHHRNAVWTQTLPDEWHGVILANEVLDCLPFRLYQKQNGQWQQRVVTLNDDDELTWTLHPPKDDAHRFLDSRNLPDGYITEISPQASALCKTLYETLTDGIILLCDYGFERDHYYHPQRRRGTLMCHRAKMADDNPLVDIGNKDITTHIDFTAIAEAASAAQTVGTPLLGYTTQANFLINAGILNLLSQHDPTTAEYAKLAAGVNKLLAPQEQGEFFKFIAFGTHPLNSPSI